MHLLLGRLYYHIPLVGNVQLIYHQLRLSTDVVVKHIKVSKINLMRSNIFVVDGNLHKMVYVCTQMLMYALFDKCFNQTV